MKNICLLIIVMLSFCCCKKENPKVEKKVKKENYDPTEYFSFPTNVKNWRNYTEIVINDSLKNIHGEFENYKIEGYLNQYNQKVNWWNILNKKNSKADNVRLEYRIIAKKEIVNQFIFYNNGRDYIKNSQFYTQEKINNFKNEYKYSFYTPNEYPKKNLMKKFEYFLYIENKEVKHLDLDCTEQDSHFSVNIIAPKSNQPIVIKGLFTELFEDNDKKPGQNEIYVLDTLK